MATHSLNRKLYLKYLEYKDLPYFSYVLYGVLIVLSLLLLLYVITPQVTNWLSVREEVARTRARILTMRENITYLENVDVIQLNDDYQVVTTALPPEGDVSRLIVAINVAALNAGIVLDDFSFQGGEQASRTRAGASRSDDTARITFSVQGSLPQTIRLLAELQQKIPLLAVESLNAQFQTNSRTNVTVVYYKKELPTIPENRDRKIEALTPNQRLLVDQLKSWQVSQIEFASPEATTSASSSPF